MIRVKLLLQIFLILVLGSMEMDYSIAITDGASSTLSDDGLTTRTVEFGCIRAPLEEVNQSEESSEKKRIRLVIANSISLSDMGNSCSSSLQSQVPLLLTSWCPTQALLASWLDKREEHILSLKSEPLWLRYSALLI